MTRDVRKIAPGRVGYSLWCDEDGHVIDNCTLFRFGQNDFRLFCQEPQYAWLHDVAWGFAVRIADDSEDVAGLSLQVRTNFALPEAAGSGTETKRRRAVQGKRMSRSDIPGG